jgi:hypothetical protein
VTGYCLDERGSIPEAGTEHYFATTLHFTITKIKWLMLFKEMMASYSEKHTKHINTVTALQIVKIVGTSP